MLATTSVSAFADLESQISRNTALIGGGKAEYEELLALSKELGASTPFDATDDICSVFNNYYSQRKHVNDVSSRVWLVDPVFLYMIR